MQRRSGGTKRSSQFTFRRRLTLVRLLLRGPQSGPELIAAVQAELGEEGYPDAAASALKHDLDALKGEYGCRIRFDRAYGSYVLDDLGELSLLDLPDACMEALAFLEASFPAGAALPEHANVRALLSHVVALMPTARRENLYAQRSPIALTLGDGAAGKIDPSTLAVVRRAIARRQELSFDYLGSFDTDTPRRHRVAAYHMFFRPEGHGYLDTTLLEVLPAGGEIRHATIHYRLDRIIAGSAKVLPQMLPPSRPLPKTYALIYRLLPVVARRRDIATYFPNTAVTYHEDGSAIVTATVTNLWQARQLLLRYGSACQVRGPAELVELFQQTAAGLAAIYTEC